jgi:hypothetical protein
MKWHPLNFNERVKDELCEPCHVSVCSKHARDEKNGWDEEGEHERDESDEVEEENEYENLVKRRAIMRRSKSIQSVRSSLYVHHSTPPEICFFISPLCVHAAAAAWANRG